MKPSTMVWLMSFGLLGVVASLGMGAARLVQLSLTQGADLRRAAARQQTIHEVILPRRGDILDTNFRVMAGTLLLPSVYVDPGLVADARFTACSIAPVLGLDAAELQRNLEAWAADGRRFVWLKRRLPQTEYAQLESIVTARRLEAVRMRLEPVREYPQGSVAPHVLGFTSLDLRSDPDGAFEPYEDLRGLIGVEAEFDPLLRGTPGSRSLTVDVGRRALRSSEQTLHPAQDGATVVLTLDTFIQELTQAALADACEEFAGTWGTAIVLDPHTGEVLAMASWPSFDVQSPFPAPYEAMTEEQRAHAADTWRNRAIGLCYEPGSIFKPIIASQALNDGLTSLDEVFTINGPTHSFSGRIIHDTHAYGQLTLHEVISKSSNIGMGLLGARCGMERLYNYVRKFGFGAPTGIELPGEEIGLLADLKDWNPRFSPQSIPVGQEIAVTAIQMAAAYGALANDGMLMQPRIVRGLIGPDGKTIRDNSQPIEVRRVLQADVARAFRLQALAETVTEHGTGRLAILKDYRVFGKTGTAQIARGHGYGAGIFCSSFAGGAPADDPRLIVLVSVYNPRQKSHYGGTVAAPAVKRILEETLHYLQVPPLEAAES